MGAGINNIGGRTTQQWKGVKAAVSGSVYQKNQKNETDPKGKLVIHNYNKDFKQMVFWGWDVIDAAELDETYIFQLAHREKPELRVYISLGRTLQRTALKYPDMMYQCYIHDDKGEWDRRMWFKHESINYKTFWQMIESVVDEYHPILPF